MSYKFNYVGVGSGGESITIVTDDGDTFTLNENHPNFGKVFRALTSGDFPYSVENEEDEQAWLAEMAGNALVSAAKVMTRLSERVTYDSENIFFDHDLIDNSLSRHLVRLIKGNQEYEPLVEFMEKLALNPSRESRRHLFHWLNTNEFTLTSEGDVVGYKAVQATADNHSITAGSNKVYVDGVEHTGNIPNPIGAVVEIARAEVDDDRSVGCSYGLHVGTHSYAEWFGGRHGNILTVAVNPRDVVSVPSDSEDRKMRVARYVVLDVSGAEVIEEPVIHVKNVSKSSVFENDNDDDSFDYEWITG